MAYVPTGAPRQYALNLKASEHYSHALSSDEYTLDLMAFEKYVLECEALWNTDEFGYTIEFSTNGDNFERKMQILSESSHRLKKGTWLTHRCSTCSEHSEGKEGIHVEIEHSLNWQEQRDEYNVQYTQMDLLRKRYPKNSVVIDRGILEDMLLSMDEVSDLFKVASLAVDEAEKRESVIEYYE